MTQNTSGKFYDIHMHAFNLSHPSLSSFLKRFFIEFGLKIVLYLIAALLFLHTFFYLWFWTATGFLFVMFLAVLVIFTQQAMSPTKYSNLFFDLVVRFFKRPLNLLALMENDLGNYFLLAERVLKNKQGAIMINDKGSLMIGGREFSKMVITPLMMDFGLPERISGKLPYGAEPIHKPIANQVADVFSGIRTYLDKSDLKLFEIFPFLGLNTQNYSSDELHRLLDKYFKEYQRTENAFRAKLGAFDGNISRLGANFFIGIKLYPPLGFDPWPDNSREKAKVVQLYSYCQSNQIPITVHCNDGGFIVDSLFVSQDRTSPKKWAQVLAEFRQLRLNLAHMGDQGKVSRFRYGKEKPWKDQVFDLIAEYDNVYTDFSCLGFTDDYYRSLKDLIGSKSVELSGVLNSKPYSLFDKIIFGSDFMINLLATDSYNDYLAIFSATKHFDDNEKEKFCQSNPERFLFS